jgi:hypothetical protein
MKMIDALAFMFRGDENREEKIPIVARPPDEEDNAESGSAVFVIEPKYMVRDIEDFEGDLTVIGRVSKVIPQGTSVNLLEMLTTLPRAIRRNRGSSENFQQAIVKLFESWPDQFGGPIAADRLELPGPALIISPLAVYS